MIYRPRQAGLFSVKPFRTSLSLPPDLAVGINTLATRLGISQSALVAVLLGETVPALLRKIKSLPDNSDTDAVLRLRGESAATIRALVRASLDAL